MEGDAAVPAEASTAEGTPEIFQGNASKAHATCNNCRKQGHMARNCWAPGGGAARPDRNQERFSQGRGNRGRGRGLQRLVPESHRIAATAESVTVPPEDWEEFQRFQAMANTMAIF